LRATTRLAKTVGSQSHSLRQSPIYEPFLGSGTTLIAAQTSGRSCFAIEIDPLYVDVAIRRWQAFTGERATLLADGRTFDAVAAERSNPPKEESLPS
jgi:DNA modification methylase